MSDERRYTLGEAKRELSKEECATYGHDFQVILRGDGTPVNVLCGRCGRSWPVGVERANAEWPERKSPSSETGDEA